MKKRVALLLTLVLVFSVFMAGCTTNNEPAQNEQPSQQTEENEQEEAKEESKPNPAKTREGADNTLIVGTNETKGDFLPVYYSTTYDGYVVDLVFSPLLTNNEEGELIPHVAKDWEISEDNRTYTFYLRDDVKFSDGTPLTAKDVEFTYLAMSDPNYDGRYGYIVGGLEGYEEYHDGNADNISGVKVIDDYTISFTFKEALATNIYNCTMNIMPKHVYNFEKGKIEDLKAKMQDLVGSGPYVMTNYVPKQYIEFKANPDYFEGAPKTENLIMKFTTVDTMISELQTGSIDVQIRVPAKPENKEMIDEPGFLKINQFPENSYGYMGFNLRDPRLADKRVRQALVYGFNRQAFIDVYYKGYAQVCNAPISQVSWAYTEDVNKYEYNPEKAMELLEEAGWKLGEDGIREKDGMKLDFVWDTYTDSKYVETLIPMLKDNWAKIGVKVEPNLMEFNALVEKVYTKREFDMYNMAWSMDIDPDGYDVFHSDVDVPDGNNSVGFRNEDNDRLLEKGRQEFDPEKRKEIYKEWAKLMNDELPYMFLSQTVGWDVYNERVKNLNTSPYVDWAMIANEIELEN